MEKETKRNQASLVTERKRHLQFAKAMMDERKLLLLELNDTKQRAEELEKFVMNERAKLRAASGVVVAERRRAAQMEAEMERQLSEFDIEREQLRAKLNREENRTQELREELEIVQKRIEELEKASSVSAPTPTPSSTTKVQKKDTGSPRAVNGIREARDRLTKTPRNPMPSVKPSKIYTVKGFQSPRAATEKSEKSESSSGSEELTSPLSPNSSLNKSVVAPAVNKPKPSSSKPALTNSKSVDLDSPRSALNKTKSSPRSSPATGSGLTRANSERNKSLSPASSLDRLSKLNGEKSSLSPASSLEKLSKTDSGRSSLSSSLERLSKSSSVEKLSKTGSGKSSLSPSSSLDKLTKSSSLDKLTKSSSLDKLSKVGVGSPPTQKSSKIPSSTSGSSSNVHKGSAGASNSPYSSPRKLNGSRDKSTSEPGKLNRVNSPSTPLNSLPQKPNLNGTAGLSRPTALSNSRGDSTRSSFRKIPAPGWPLSGSPSTSPTKPVDGASSIGSKGSSWRKTSSTGNISSNQQATTKASSLPQGKQSVPSSNGLKPPESKGSTTQSSQQQPQPNGQLPKKPPSPRGTPPPIPPNKPTLIPQKSNATTPATSSVTTVNTPPQKPDSNKNTLPTAPPPVTTMGLRKSESLVEARKQFYNNKLGSGSTNISHRPPLDNYHLVCANTNANNSNDGNKTICNANEEPACCGPIVDNSPATQNNAPSQVGESVMAILPHAGDEGAPIYLGQTPNQCDTSLHGRFLPVAEGKNIQNKSGTYSETKLHHNNSRFLDDRPQNAKHANSTILTSCSFINNLFEVLSN